MQMFKPRFFLLLISLLVLLHAAPAMAADINAEGAAKLKTLFENLLANQKSLSKPDGTHLDYDGAVVVEQATTYYAVTLPHARLTYPDGSRLDIGMVSINASPHDNPGQWKMAVAVPTPIILLDAKQTQAIKITIGAQKTAGIWDETLESFAKMDAQYKNITIENPVTGFTMQIPEFQALHDFSNTGDRWSGPGSIVFKDMTGTAPNQANFKFKEVRGDFAIDQYSPATLKEYRAHLKAYMDSIAAGGEPDPQKSAQFASSLSEFLLNSSNGMKASYKISGFEAMYPDAATKKSTQVRLDTTYLGLSATGFLNDNASFNMIMGFDGFSVNPPPPSYEGILPAVGKVELAFTNIPVRKLSEAAQNTLQTSMQNPEMAQLAGLSLLMTAPTILSQAATTMEIKNSHIGNNDYKYEISGIAKADAAAVNKITAHFNGLFQGLDRLIGRVQAVAATPTHPKAKSAQNLLNFLLTMKSQGAPKAGADSYSYEFIMDAQGKTTMNGKPLGAALGAMPPAAMPMAVPPTVSP
jgi:hypothetical protein